MRAGAGLIQRSDTLVFEHPVEKIGALAINTLAYRTPPLPDDDEPPKPTAVELPARYSVLTTIVGLLAALVVLISIG